MKGGQCGISTVLNDQKQLPALAEIGGNHHTARYFIVKIPRPVTVGDSGALI